MSTLSILILAALLLFFGFIFGFVAGLDWRDHQARTERRKAEMASKLITQPWLDEQLKAITNRTTGERRMYISRNGRLIGMDGGKRND